MSHYNDIFEFYSNDSAFWLDEETGAIHYGSLIEGLFGGVIPFSHEVLLAKDCSCSECGVDCKCLGIGWFDKRSEVSADPNNYFWR